MKIKVDRKMNAPTIEGEGFHNAEKDFTGGDGADIPYSVRRNKNRR